MYFVELSLSSIFSSNSLVIQVRARVYNVLLLSRFFTSFGQPYYILQSILIICIAILQFGFSKLPHAIENLNNTNTVR